MVEACWVIAAKGKVSLLSGATAQLLGLVSLMEHVQAVKPDEPKTMQEVLEENQEVFKEELGKISKIQAKLNLKKGPNLSSRRRGQSHTPNIQEAVEEELRKWEEDGVAESRLCGEGHTTGDGSKTR